MTAPDSQKRPGAGYWVEKLGLTRHIEGGSFREVYRSAGIIPHHDLPEGFAGDRPWSTSIYFLLEKGQFSAFHRIASDELWHFYFGDPLLVYEIDEQGVLLTHRLGPDPENGESFQVFVKAGRWFASVPAAGSDYSLVGCTVAPGFDFADFSLAEKTALQNLYPQHADLIGKLTRH